MASFPDLGTISYPKITPVPSPRIIPLSPNTISYPKIIPMASPKTLPSPNITPRLKVIPVPSPRVVTTPNIFCFPKVSAPSPRILMKDEFVKLPKVINSPVRLTTNIPIPPELMMPRAPDGEAWEAIGISNEESYRLFREDWISNNSDYDYYYVDNSAIDKYNDIYASAPHLFGRYVNLKKHDYHLKGQLGTQPVSFDIICEIGPVIAYYDDIKSIKYCNEYPDIPISNVVKTPKVTTTINKPPLGRVIICEFSKNNNYDRYISQGLKIPIFAMKVR